MNTLLRQSDVKRVAVIGPESTGKSELSQYLAGVFETVWVEEYARTYLDQLGRPYRPEDLISIAEGQIALEDAMAGRARRVLICDTNLYVIKIWSMFKYGSCDPRVLAWMETRKYDLYLLTYVDLPWVPDPYREHPDQREALYDLYLHEMKNQQVPFEIIRGDRRQRRETAVLSIRRLLDQGGGPPNPDTK